MIVVPQLPFHGRDVADGEELPPVRRVREAVAAGAQQVSLLDLDGVVADDLVPQWLLSLIAVAGAPVWLDARLEEVSRLERLARTELASVVLAQRATLDAAAVRWAVDMLGSRLVVELQLDGPYLFDPPSHLFGSEAVDVVRDLHMQGIRRILLRDVGAESPGTDRVLQLANAAPNVRFSYWGPVTSVAHVTALASIGRAMDAVLVDAGRIDVATATRAAAP